MPSSDPHLPSHVLAEQQDAIREWLQTNFPAYSGRPVRSGDWLARLAAGVVAARQMPPVELQHRGPWELWPRKDMFELRPILYQPSLASVVFYPRPESAVGVRQLWRWRCTGAREAWFLEGDQWRECDVIGLLAYRLVRRFTRFALFRGDSVLDRPQVRTRIMMRAMRLVGREGPPTICHTDLATPNAEVWPNWIAADNARELDRPIAARPLRVGQYVGALYPGGAERQLCNLAAGLLRRGVDVRVVTRDSLEGERGHYTALLRQSRVPCRMARAASLTPEHALSLPWNLLRAVPSEVRQAALALAAELAADPPDILHAWLDEPNVIAAIAGLLAGVRCIILSTRNVNPTNFPRFNTWYFRQWYQIAALSRRIHFIANSHSGAASYASWMGILQERMHVVFNGIDLSHFPMPTVEARRKARAAFGLSEADRVVSGVFRLAEEKQPELFLDVIRRVRSRVPNLHVLLAGGGDLEERVAQMVNATGMSDYVSLLGRRSDVGTILLASDAKLLTSKVEGCPNIALETQHLGTPIVATAGGGTVDAVDHGRTGFLAGIHDAAALAEHLTNLLTDEPLRQRLASAGPGFIASRFSLESMIDNTWAVYEQALGLVPSAHSSAAGTRALVA
jgi:glycosyltransferase involved in cell wall biosynthesis